jgi:hypothetical protein
MRRKPVKNVVLLRKMQKYNTRPLTAGCAKRAAVAQVCWAWRTLDGTLRTPRNREYPNRLVGFLVAVE